MGGLKEWARDERGRFAPEGEGSAIGVRELNPGHPTYDPKYYSFGSTPGETHVATVPLTREDIKHVVMEGSLEGVRHLQEKMGRLNVPSGHMLVFRLADKEDKGLANSNGANMKGIVNHIEDMDARDMGHGDHLHAYVVPRPEKFAAYTEMRGKVERGK